MQDECEVERRRGDTKTKKPDEDDGAILIWRSQTKMKGKTKTEEQNEDQAARGNLRSKTKMKEQYEVEGANTIVKEQHDNDLASQR